MTPRPSPAGEKRRESRARPWRNLLEPIACSLVPGMLAGIQLAGLLFFLNPHWPFEFMPLVRAVTLYAVLLAIGSLLLLLPFTWRQPERARRVLPWAWIRPRRKGATSVSLSNLGCASRDRLAHALP